MPALDPISYLAIFAALALGGVLKGATGAGVPVIAVPVIAAVVDVRFAVVIMVIVNLLSNVQQLWRFRSHRIDGGFAMRFAVAGAVGALVGTGLLVALPVDVLSGLLAGVVFAYIGLRLARPSFRLAMESAWRWVVPAGVVGGVFQGAAGISAPVSVSFLNAARLERPVFIFTISAFFTGMGLVQLPALLASGLMTLQILGLSFIAILPVLVFMPLGDWLGKRASPEVFDRVILVFLGLLALRLAAQLVL
ncbi:MAG: sulfite exporter TauE/SafE family protein [Pseudomonadota bacterium]